MFVFIYVEEIEILIGFLFPSARIRDMLSSYLSSDCCSFVPGTLYISPIIKFFFASFISTNRDSYSPSWNIERSSL